MLKGIKNDTESYGAPESPNLYKFQPTTINKAAKGDWDFRNSDLLKTLMELIFNPCGEFRWSPEGPVSQIHSPHLQAGALGIFPDF